MLGKPFPVANDGDVDMGLANVPFLAQYRPKTSATLCPPKPNELLMAYW
jgi:hypothetical protein